MLRALRNILVLAVLAAIAAATWYLQSTSTPESITRQAAGSPTGYYLRDATFLRTGDDGRIVYRIHADLAEERPEDGKLVLSGVRIEYMPAEQVPWRVHAARAEVSPETSTLELEGGVVLTREAAENRAPTIVRTEHLRLEPESHVATASGAISFSVGPNTLAAEGLKAFLKEDRLELESSGHGRFQP